MFEEWRLAPLKPNRSSLPERIFKMVEKSPEPVPSDVIRNKMGISKCLSLHHLHSLEIGGKICVLWHYRKGLFEAHRTGPLNYYVTCRSCPLNPCPNGSRSSKRGGGKMADYPLRDDPRIMLLGEENMEPVAGRDGWFYCKTHGRPIDNNAIGSDYNYRCDCCGKLYRRCKCKP